MSASQSEGVGVCAGAQRGSQGELGAGLLPSGTFLVSRFWFVRAFSRQRLSAHGWQQIVERSGDDGGLGCLRLKGRAARPAARVCDV